MRFKIFTTTLFLIFAFFTILRAQQLPERSTHDANAFIWNPATTGVYDYWEVGATYQQQWAGFEDAPRTIMASFQYPFAGKNMAVGLYIQNDQTHPLSFNAIGFTYSYQFKLNLTKDDYFSLGLLGTYGEYRLDINNIITSTSFDPLTPIDGESQIIPNAGAGFFYTTNKDKYAGSTFYLGMGAQQLFSSSLKFDGTEQDVSFMQAPHFNAMTGFTILINDYTYVEPSAWVNYARKNIFDVNLGVRIEQEDTFWAAANFDFAQNFSLQGGVILTDGIFQDGQFRIGGMATYNVGVLGTDLGLGYEVYLGYRFYQ